MTGKARRANKGAKAIQSEYSEAGVSPGFLLWKASNSLLRLQAAELRPLDITPAQSAFLASVVYLSATNPQLTQTDVARHTGLDKMFVSDMMRILLKKGFIRIEPHERDARARRLIPNAKGRKKVVPAIDAMESVDRRFFGRLPDINRFVKALQVLLGDG